MGQENIMQVVQTSKLDLIWRSDGHWCAEKNQTKTKKHTQKKKLWSTEKASYFYALRSSSAAVVQKLL